MPIDAPAPEIPVEPSFESERTDDDAPGYDMVVDPTVLYDAYRRQIEHEEHQISQRGGGLLLSQSFFVMGYCVLQQLTPPTARAQPVIGLLTHLLAAVGAITNVPLLLSTIGASNTMQALRQRFAGVAARRADVQAMLAEYPPLHSAGKQRMMGRSVALVLPVFFIMFWVSLIAVTWLRR